MLKSLFHLCIVFAKKVTRDNVSAISAHTAFFIMISFFPFTMFLLTLLQYLPVFSDGIPEFGLEFLPQAVSGIILKILDELSENANGTILSLTVIATVWSASRAFFAIMRGLNSIHDISESRNYFVIRIIAILYTLLFAALLLITMIIFVFGNRLTVFLLDRYPVLGDYAALIISARTVTGIAVLFFFFLLIYSTLPNRKVSLLRSMPGALLTALGWVGFSFLYSFYIDNMSNYTATYGSLTAIVLCMLWLYACMYILFIGAELNVILANPYVHRSIQKFFRNTSSK